MGRPISDFDPSDIRSHRRGAVSLVLAEAAFLSMEVAEKVFSRISAIYFSKVSLQSPPGGFSLYPLNSTKVSPCCKGLPNTRVPKKTSLPSSGSVFLVWGGAKCPTYDSPFTVRTRAVSTNQVPTEGLACIKGSCSSELLLAAHFRSVLARTRIDLPRFRWAFRFKAEGVSQPCWFLGEGSIQ